MVVIMLTVWLPYAKWQALTAIDFIEDGLMPEAISSRPHGEQLVIDIRRADLFSTRLDQTINSALAQDLFEVRRENLIQLEALGPFVIHHE